MAEIIVPVAISGLTYLVSSLLAEDVVNEGPRRDDLAVTAVQPGNPMPRPYGRGPCPGHCIYQTPLIESVEEEEVGGKGGPSATNRTYTYSIHAAWAFSAKEILDGVELIRANQKVLWSGSVMASLTESEIDALVSAKFTEVYDAIYADLIAEGYSPTDADAIATEQAQAAADAERETLEAASDARGRFSEIEIFLGTSTQNPSAILEALEGVGAVPAFRDTAYFVVKDLQLADFGNAPPHIKVDVNASLVVESTPPPQMVQFPGDAGTSLTITPGQTLTIPFSPALQEDDVVVVFISSGLSTAGNIVIQTTGYTDANAAGHLPLGGWTWQQFWWKRMGATPDTQVQVKHNSGSINGVVGYFVVRGAAPDTPPWRTTPSSAINKATGTSGNPNPNAVTPVDRNDLLVLLGNHDDTQATPVALPNWTLTHWGRSGGGSSAQTGFIYHRTVDDLSAVDPPTISPIGNDGWGVHHLAFKPATPWVEEQIGDTSIGDVLEGELTDWGYDPSPLVAGDHFDIPQALYDMRETGAVFTRLSTPREIADMCAKIRPIIFFEDGEKIRFIERDGDPAWTINALHMRARAHNEEVDHSVETTWVDAAQLPREVHVNFIDELRGYSGNSAWAKVRGSRANAVETIETVFVGTPSRFKRAAHMNLIQMFGSRRRHRAQLPYQYFPLEPGDKGWLPMSDATETLVRPVQIEEGANGTFRMEFVDHIASDDDATIDAETGGSDPPPVKLVTKTVLAVMDIPRLTDDPDEAAHGVYVTAGGIDADWPGAAVYLDELSEEGTDGVPIYTGGETSYRRQATLGTRGQIGTVAILPGAAASEYVIDTASTLVIAFKTYGASFSSLTDAEFETTVRNSFLIGSEIVQARDVVKLAEGLFQFSHLRRGMRGTEWAIDQHAVGERAVWLEATRMARIEIVPDAVGLALRFKAVTLGADIVGADTVTLTYSAQALVPFAPDLASAERNAAGDVTIELMKRSFQRDADSTIDGGDPLTASDEFHIEILSAGSPAAALRTIGPSGMTVTTEGLAQFSYTAAQQVTDFGSTQAAIAANLYQLDAAGARGHARRVTL